MVFLVFGDTIVCFDTKTECCIRCNEVNDYDESCTILQGGSWNTEECTDTFRICKYCEREMIDDVVCFTNRLDMLIDCNCLIIDNKRYWIQVVGFND